MAELRRTSLGRAVAELHRGRRRLRDAPPLIHFLLLGAVIVMLRALAAPDPEPEAIELSADARQRWHREWIAAAGRAPTPAEEHALARDAIDEEILFREALALGLHRRDAVVQERLARNLRFLEPERATEDEATLAREARARDLHRGDLVVRRRLVERMRDILLAGAPQGGAAEAMPESAPVEGVRISHVFAKAGDDAGLRELERSLRGWPIERAAERGDAFLLGTHLPLESPAALDARFGPGFAERLSELPIGGWSGPIASSYGHHFVWIHERRLLEDGGAPLRAAALGRERDEAALRAALAPLRSRYRVRTVD